MRYGFIIGVVIVLLRTCYITCAHNGWENSTKLIHIEEIKKPTLQEMYLWQALVQENFPDTVIKLVQHYCAYRPLHRLSKFANSLKIRASINSDGWIAITDGGKQAALWKVYNGGGYAITSIKTSQDIHAHAFSPDGSSLALGCANGYTYVYTPHKKLTIRPFTNVRGQRKITSVVHSHDSPCIAILDESLVGNHINMWDYENNVRVKKEISLSAEHGIIAAVFLKRDKEIAVTGKINGQVSLITMNGDKPDVTTLPGYTRAVLCATFNQDASLLLTGGLEGKAIVWDLNERKPLQKVPCSSLFSALAFHPDGTLIATGEYDSRKVRCWNTSNGEMMQEFECDYTPKSIAFNNSGDTLLVADDGGIVSLFGFK